MAVVISSLVFPPLADKFGRKPIGLIGLSTHLLFGILLLLSKSQSTMYFCVFMLGLAMPARVFVGYIYAMEMMPSRNTQMATSVILGNDGLVMMWTSLYFMYVGKTWSTFFGLTLVGITVALVVLAMRPESPSFLVNQGRFDEAR